MYEDEVILSNPASPTESILQLTRSIKILSEVASVDVTGHIDSLLKLLEKELKIQHDIHDDFCREYRTNNPRHGGSLSVIKP